MKQAQTKNTMPASTNMAPALVETYSRLLVYTEIESLGIKGFLGMERIHQFTYSSDLVIISVSIGAQVNYCQQFSNHNRGVFCTRYWKCYPIACITFSHLIECNCYLICIRWLQCRIRTKRSCIYASNPLHCD